MISEKTYVVMEMTKLYVSQFQRIFSKEELTEVYNEFLNKVKEDNKRDV